MYNFDNLPKELVCGARELISTIGIKETQDGIPVFANNVSGEIGIEKSTDKIVIFYDKKVHFFRMLSMINTAKDNYTETPRHDNLSYMADQSRNAVFNMESAKRLARYLALLGYNELQLYTEED